MIPIRNIPALRPSTTPPRGSEHNTGSVGHVHWPLHVRVCASHTCVSPDWGGQVGVAEQRFRKLPAVVVQQAGERAHAQPEHEQKQPVRPRWGDLLVPGRGFAGFLEADGCVLPVAGFGFQRPVTEAAIAVTQVEVIVVVTIAGPAQSAAPSSQVHLHHLIDGQHISDKLLQNCGSHCEVRLAEQFHHLSSGGVGVLRAATGEVGGLVGSDGGVPAVVLVGGQRVALFRLQHLIGCGSRRPVNTVRRPV